VTHTYLCPLRWGDLDAQGHVNNASYLDYLQEARVDFLLSGPPIMQRLLDTGVLVVSHQLEYLHPVHFSEEPIRIELWVDSIGASRFTIGYELFSGEPLVARARTGAAPFDLASNSLRRLLPEERTALEAVHAPGQPLSPLPRAGRHESGHSYPLRVRWSDLDSYGHVNNVKYYDYIQEARIALMSQVLEWSAEDVWVIVRQDMEYLRPIDFRTEPYEVRTVVAAIGQRSFTLAVDINDPGSGTVFATARTVVVGQAPLSNTARSRLESWSLL
jgi:acyl-CoA thioester hydrolase